jgi:hypothetical protein
MWVVRKLLYCSIRINGGAVTAIKDKQISAGQVEKAKILAIIACTK